jgi:hypothetical protein
MPPERAVRIFHLVPAPKDRERQFGEFKSVNSILHSLDSATVSISRYIETAYFAPGDIEREIKRLSQRFGAAPHILQSPRRSGSPRGVIAYWGAVTLAPVDTRSLAQLAAGQSVTKGMLFDFLGNFGISARDGFPIFQLGGAHGYVWGAQLARGLRQWPRELVLARPTIIAALIKTNAITARTPPTIPSAWITP